MLSSKPPSQRPQFRVCYLCGQQFGSASIGIHVPQCYQKKLSQWEVGNPAVRGPKPKHPDAVNWKGGGGATTAETNQEQYQEFNAQLVPCPHCARTFLPDRLPVHLRGCKGDGKEATSPGKGKAVGGGGAASGKRKSEPRSASRGRSLSSGPPLLPTCYLCGQQFGTASIAIHVPQCYEKKMAQWQNADPHLRGQAPKHPDAVNWRGRGGASAHEQAEEQFQEFINNLEACPNCSRRFLPDRLVVHLRSCRPGNPAKSATPSSSRTAAGGASGARVSGTGTATGADEAVTSARGGAAEKERPPRPMSATSEERLDPKRNRLPRKSALPSKSRACPQCAAVEYDADAKFCRECGHAFDAGKSSAPCKHCGERIPQGSRFCGTCGQPVQGAATAERTPGKTNANVSVTRSVLCPACEAISDADGNFCDNCGAALGDADAAPAAPVAKIMRCPTCGETVADATALFCEDCGGRLEAADDGAAPPQRTDGTLPPQDVARLSKPAVRAPQAQPPVPQLSKAPTATRGAANGVARSGAAAPPLPPSPAVGDQGDGEDAYAEDDGERVPCDHCGRRFAPEALARHERVCATQKKRRVFNATKHRVADGATAAAKASGSAPQTAPKRDWKSESEAFRRALREARQVDQVLKAGGNAKDLPPPMYSENPDYLACPHCQRRFAPDVAARHIPRCANTVNRPKPPPRRR